MGKLEFQLYLHFKTPFDWKSVDDSLIDAGIRVHRERARVLKALKASGGFKGPKYEVMMCPPVGDKKYAKVMHEYIKETAQALGVERRKAAALKSVTKTTRTSTSRRHK